ncbi:MAG: hypothetical protein AAFO91_19145, partial [Bacteroidota bacterium]
MPVISDLLGIAPVELTEIHNVNNSNFIRARVANEANRKQLLLKCHQLRDSDRFSRVYFNRDLTYQQRQDLRHRRAEARAQGPSRLMTQPNSIPVSRLGSGLGSSSGRFACLQEE